MTNTNANEKSSLQIVPQTKIAFIGYVLLLVAQIVFLVQKPQSITTFLPNLIGFIIIAILGLYVVNCSVLGHCNMYAWIIGYIVVALGVLSVVALVYKLA